MLALKQNDTIAPPTGTEQHSGVAASVQSTVVWHATSWMVPLQLVGISGGQLPPATHCAPNDVMPQSGNDPLPFSMSTAQQIGVAPPQSSGPLQTIWSAGAQFVIDDAHA